MPIDTEQWRAHTGLFCASRVFLRPPRRKQPQPKVQADTLSLNLKISLAVLLVTLRTGIFYASRALQLLCLIACHVSWLLSSIVRLSCRRLRGVSVLLALCLVVLQMLLIMSGDVEENPGPPKRQKAGSLILNLKRRKVETDSTIGDWPTMLKLLSFPGRHGDMNIPQQIGASYIQFGTFLLNDESQARVTAIANQYNNQAEQINMHLLREWLQGSGIKPVTWDTLAKVLTKVRLDPLAEEIAWHCQGTVMHQHLLASDVQREQIRPPVYPTHMPPADTLSPADQYASYLRSVYTSKKLPTYSKWPPSSSKKFIHLAVVRKERVSKKEADEFTRATIHGTGIDDIYRKKEAADFSRVGKKEDGSLEKLILVEGAPGIGKTTFAWEVCRKWARGEILQEYGLVVLLRLRDKRVRKVKTVFDLFHHPNPELSRAVGTEILHHEGESVLLLYEGYDELPGKMQEQQSVFLNVLHRNYLPHATILITSRPSATEYLRREFNEQISQHIEILGFTKDDIISYVHNVMEDEQVCTNFFQYLKCYPYIRGMMYVPLNAVIVTEVYKISQQSPEKFIPTTMTELYTALTRSLLLRYLHSHSEYGQRKWNLKVFTDLPKELYKQFCDITAVALKGMIEDTFVFDDLPNDFNTLDLMQSVPELYVDQGALVSYNFFHLTLQEYLAAVNISHQPIEKQIEFFQTSSFRDPLQSQIEFQTSSFFCSPSLQSQIEFQTSLFFCSPSPVHDTIWDPRVTDTKLHPSPVDPPSSVISTRLRNVLRFVAGLTKFKGVPVATLQPLVLRDSFHLEAKTMALKSLHWLFESQYSDTYNEVVSPYHLFTKYGSRMLPFDYFVLGYAMAHITSHWEINLHGSGIDDEGIQMLVAGVTFDFTQSEENRMLQHLNVSNNSIGDRGATTLAEMLKENRTLQQLNISSNSIGHGGAAALAEMLKENRTLQQLNISSNSIGNGGAIALAEMLKENRTLQQLDVSINSIGVGGATALAEILKENRSLQQLVVRVNSIGDRGATALAEMLKENRTLQQLNVSSNSIGDGGATALAEMLKENRTLQQLDVRANCIGNGGATALAEMLKENRTLQYLNVSGNSIGHGGAIALAEMLKENRTLQQLNVSINSIGVGGATALAEILKENRSLQQLVARVNSIGDRGATALAEMLKENRTLQQLNVGSNSIGDGGATALAEILKENRTLQQLNVSGNSIGDGGATALAEMLKENRTLQHLNVSWNSIGNGGHTALVEMLKQNKTVSIIL